jgi:hypothetical protein
MNSGILLIHCSLSHKSRYAAFVLRELVESNKIQKMFTLKELECLRTRMRKVGGKELEARMSLFVIWMDIS